MENSMLSIKLADLPPARTSRTEILLNRPDSLDELCAHISNGGSLTTLAEAWDIRYSDIMGWMRRLPEREAAYNKAMCDRAEWEKERLLEELRCLAYYRMTGIYNADGTVKPVDQWPEDCKRALSSIEVDELEEFDPESKEMVKIGITRKVKFHSKSDAHKMLGHSTGAFIEKREEKHTFTFDQLVGKSMKQVKATILEAKKLGQGEM